jgi:hypothetical protein
MPMPINQPDHHKIKEEKTSHSWLKNPVVKALGGASVRAAVSAQVLLSIG